MAPITQHGRQLTYACACSKMFVKPAVNPQMHHVRPLIAGALLAAAACLGRIILQVAMQWYLHTLLKAPYHEREADLWTGTRGLSHYFLTNQ